MLIIPLISLSMIPFHQSIKWSIQGMNEIRTIGESVIRLLIISLIIIHLHHPMNSNRNHCCERYLSHNNYFPRTTEYKDHWAVFVKMYFCLLQFWNIYILKWSSGFFASRQTNKQKAKIEKVEKLISERKQEMFRVKWFRIIRYIFSFSLPFCS